jgi:uncharacterized protein
METRFEWEPAKADANLRKHGVSFEEARSAFFDPLHLVRPDRAHSFGEERFALFGYSEEGHALVVIHTEGADSIRIISARRMTRREARDYERG